MVQSFAGHGPVDRLHAMRKRAGMATLQTKGRTPLPSAALMARARGEYREMPGLRLTVAQACRLWQVGVVPCTQGFRRLVSEGFLEQTNTGFYLASRDRCTESP